VESSIIGRGPELTAISELLEGSATGPALLELEGVAGVGKTTLWEAGCARARAEGRRVLPARGASTEVRLGYAGLGDLLAEVDGSFLGRLPAPQARALEAALLRSGEEGAPREPRTVATGLLSVLELLAAEGPLLLALDDLQWLDPSSADALRFAVRRVGGPVGVLASLRPQPADPLGGRLALRDPGRERRLALAPLASAEIERLVGHGGEEGAAPGRVRQIVEVAAGNPFIALELARAVDAGAVEAGGAALPRSLQEIVDARLGRLGPDAREAVLLASMLTRPDVPTVQEALAGRDAGELLGEAEAAGIVALHGADIAFSHPLLATGAYSSVPAPERRAAHRRIATVTGGEERARHLALASLAAEPEVIAALDEAAAAARGRGASSAAAELLELALRLGATDAERRRLVGEHHLDAGDTRRSRELFEELVAELPPGSQRARALGGLGTVHRLADDFAGSRRVLEQAMAESEEEGLRLAISLELAFLCTQLGELHQALVHAEDAMDHAERLNEDGPLAQALAQRTFLHFLTGDGLDEESLERSLALEDQVGRAPGVLRPSLIGGLLYMWTGRLDEAQEMLDRVREQYRERGEESDLAQMTMHSGTLACARGDLGRARRLVEDSLEVALQLGSPISRAVALENQVEVAAWAGEVEAARAAGAEAIELGSRFGSTVSSMFTAGALGLLELSLGNFEAAAELLGPAAAKAIAIGSGDPDTLPLVPDAVEALAALGRVEQARPLQAWVRVHSDEIGRSTLLAVAARCDGAVLAAEGDLDGAEAALGRALAEHERLPLRYEVGRTLLALGQVQRRRRRRAAARATLERAAEEFGALGAVLWRERAERERERVDPVGSGTAELTPAEEQIALLAGAGRTNREVATELFVSPKTVETTLTRVYRKLGIASRAELGGWMALREAGDGVEQGTPSTTPR
jgi:DNA-binding CsgD family transcriptional regulator